ncbi:MAG: 5'-methylthioadenosine/S-adenosylhomocysteine nucleosidase [Corallococcus sp.]|nr:5'-methylthioadenosine/S-adenosylhomocysteine nucleosidase [Corallococcus sp.]
MKVGIVVAMQEELKPFVANKSYSVEPRGCGDIYSFTVAESDVFAVLLRHVGEICAASATQLLISECGVDVLINFGVVGALKKEITLLSSVLVDSVVHYDMDTSSIDGCERGRYLYYDDVAIPADRALLDLARSIYPDMPTVRCASADKFVESAEQKEALAQEFGAQICDMESAGVLMCANLSNIPVLIVKVVSDSLNGGGGEFEENVGRASQKFADFVDKIVERLRLCPTK